MKTHGVIYKHTNKINNKVYIGQTIRVEKIERRWRKSDKTYKSYKSCPAMFNALTKYGWDNFETEVIFHAFDQDALNRAEEYFINFHNALAPNGYNSSMLVDGSVKFTEEIKKKISDSHKAYHASLSIPVVAPNKKEHIFIGDIEYKSCGKCKDNKTLDAYSKSKNRWDGLSALCKKCSYKPNSTYRPKLTPEQLKQSYKDRNEAMQAGVLKSYQDNPNLRTQKSKQMSKTIIGTHIKTGKEIEFDSGLSAKAQGFNNAVISSCIRNGKIHKNYTWRLK